MNRAVILSSGMYVPQRCLPNSWFNEQLGEDVDTWLVENLTIRQRYWCTKNESTADLCVNAAKAALDNAGISADCLDLIIIATDTPEYISPATASVVQHRLNAVNAGTFDVNAACAGFVTGMDIAAKYFAADPRYQKILVIGAYAMSKYLNKTDKKTVTLFADGAGAVLLGAEKTETRGFLASSLITQGQYYDWMGIYAGGTHQPINREILERKAHLLKFVKKFPKELNPIMWSNLAKNLSQQIGISPQEVDHYFITQINIKSIREMLNRLEVPYERAHTIMDRYAYTGSACIPMAFHDAVESGKIKRGELAFFIGSGGGLAFAATAFRY